MRLKLANRKKRLKKGIESIEKQIKLHKEKLEKTTETKNIDLEGYYKKEIKHLEAAKERKKKQAE